MEKFAGGSVSIVCGSILFPGGISVAALQTAVNELIRLNDALRIRIQDKMSEVEQSVCPYLEQTFDVLHFSDKKELHAYAEGFAKEPLDLNGILYDFKIVMLPESYGILAKLHHMICDAWSMSLLATQLNAILQGRTPMPASYSDYVSTEQKYLQSSRYISDKYFFLEQFQKCREVTYLSKTQARSLNSERYTVHLDQETSTMIQSFSGCNQVSAFQIFLSALAIYISRTNDNAQRFYLGTTIFNRFNRAEKNTVGMFVNTVPMLMEIDSENSFYQYIKQLSQNTFSMLRHQRFHYGDFLKAIRHKYHFGEKLYDVTLNYQSADISMPDNCEITWFSCGMQTDALDIHIKEDILDNTFTIHYDYLTDCFSKREILRMHKRMQILLQDAIRHSEKKIYELELLMPTEKEQLLSEYNHLTAPFPKEKTVHQLFEETVKSVPDATAVISCDRTLTYSELNEQANCIAHNLIERGVKVGDIVAFILHRRSVLFSTMLGILKSGAAYMPISPDYPKERVNYMLADSQAVFCITEENIGELLMHSDHSNPCVSMDSDNICYCIYTSGSTGKPKGTLIMHRNLSNFIKNYIFPACIQPKSIVSVTSVVFDAFVVESLAAIINKVVVLFADEETSLNQAKLNKLLLKHPVDILQVTPTVMYLLMQDETQLDYLKNLKCIILGGEELTSDLITRILKHTKAVIYNDYGPTETTVAVANTIVNHLDITIGKPIANTQIYIVDKHMNQTPIGVAGELCIAGDCVGAGYLNRPELTKEKFVDNPFGEGKLYKTGDLAWWREDGKIVYVGRNDFQVKIHGLRMELGEIENAINNMEGISQTIVVVRKDEREAPYLCAFYTGTQAVSEAMIRKELATVLPKYMIPQFFLHLETMPMTPGGKIDRNALPEVDLHMLHNHTVYIPLKGEMECRLAAIMEKVLYHSPIGREDDFFELGGDSLKAIEFAAKAHYDGILFDLQAVFEHPNVMQLASYIHNGNRNMETVYHREDFLKYQRLLENNSSIQVPASEHTLGNILLTGATGFLGSHILHRLLKENTGKIYCLVREDVTRLKDILTYYFGSEDAENECIQPVIGSLESLEFLDIPKVDMVIHAAASVKHYGSYQHFYEVNVEGTKNAINFAKRKHAIFLQISTLSVSGMEESTNKIVDFDERNLYIGQKLDNVYVRSKFEAERFVLDAALDGLSAGIIRVGNLTNRITDGMFQKNHESNAFLKRVKAFLELGCFPDYLKDAGMEFSPVDETAEAILTIAKHFDGSRTVFHGNNPKMIPLRSIIQWLSKMGIHMEEVPGKLFLARLKEPEQHAAYETLSNDLDSEEKLAYRGNIRVYSSITSDYLKACGFEWSDITPEYLQKYIDYFKKIHYLEV